MIRRVPLFSVLILAWPAMTQAQIVQNPDLRVITRTDGVVPVGDGSKFVGESGATLRTSLGLGTTIVAEGDSLTADPDGWPSLVDDYWAGSRATVYNYAVSGHQADEMVGQYATQSHLVSPGHLSRPAERAIFSLLAGTNDLNHAVVAADVYADLVVLWAAAKADGYEVVAFTLPPASVLTGSEETNRVALNVLILSNLSLYDHLCDLASILPNNLDATYYVDGTHFTAAGKTVVCANVIRLIAASAGEWTNSSLNFRTTGTVASGAVSLSAGGQYNQVRLASDAVDSATQRIAITGRHYDTDEEPVMILGGYVPVGENRLMFGGGSSIYNTATSLLFYTAADTTTTTGTIRLAITPAGNIGISETAPSTKLHVTTSTAADGLIAGSLFAGCWNDGATYAVMAHSSFRTTDSGTKYAFIQSNSGETYFNSAATKQLGFCIAGNRKAVIDSDGEMGIGETAPDYKLDVNGSLGITPGASVTPADNGDVVFQLTDNTTLTIKAKGSDGTVRSVALTLAP